MNGSARKATSILRATTRIRAEVVLALLLVSDVASGRLGYAAEPRKPDIPQATLSPSFAKFAEERLVEARRRHGADTNNLELAWQLARATFFAGEFATDAVRTALAQEGIALGKDLTLRAPTLAEGHYYLALNLGQLARTRWLSALGIVKDLEHSLKLARDMKPPLDHAGPDRCLGQLYRDAPGWPISVGSKSKARQHLLRAVELAPHYPENRLELLETWLLWGERKTLQRDLEALAAALPAARKQFSGPAWAPYWDDWERRWKSVEARVGAGLKKK